MKKQEYKKASICDCLNNYYQKFDKVYNSDFQKEANINNAKILLLRKIKETENCGWRKAHERFREILQQDKKIKETPVLRFFRKNLI